MAFIAASTENALLLIWQITLSNFNSVILNMVHFLIMHSMRYDVLFYNGWKLNNILLRENI